MNGHHCDCDVSTLPCVHTLGFHMAFINSSGCQPILILSMDTWLVSHRRLELESDGGSVLGFCNDLRRNELPKSLCSPLVGLRSASVEGLADSGDFMAVGVVPVLCSLVPP